MTRLLALRAHVRAHAENRPGVYRLLGPGGELLYVGKSVRVRTRLLSYFRARHGQKAAGIMAQTHRVEWDYTPSEFAALLHELRLIKRRRPIYNVEHKRDGVYCFIKLTREPAPRIHVAGRVREDGALYHGPFRGRRRLREAVRELADLLELRDCRASTRMRFADQVELFPRDDPPLCMRGDLARCLAPCAGRCTRAAYLERVDRARAFLDGDAARPLAILDERMHAAAQRLQFEYAAKLRDRAERLKAVREELVALGRTLDGLSFLYPVPGHDGDDRCYLIHRGRVRLELPMPATEAQRSASAVQVREALAARPGLAAADAYEMAEVLLVARWFRLQPAERGRALPIDALEAPPSRAARKRLLTRRSAAAPAGSGPRSG